MVLRNLVLECAWHTRGIQMMLDRMGRSLGCSDHSLHTLQTSVDDPKFSTRHRELARTALGLFWGLKGVFEYSHDAKGKGMFSDVENGVAKIAVVLVNRHARDIEPYARSERISSVPKPYHWRRGSHRLHRELRSTVVVFYELAKRREPSLLIRCSQEGDCQDGLMYLENDDPRCWFHCPRSEHGLWSKLVLEAAVLDADTQKGRVSGLTFFESEKCHNYLRTRPRSIFKYLALPPPPLPKLNGQ